jgi:hypothetical protein
MPDQGADAMADAAETLAHPVLGVLRWEAEYSWWFTQHQLPGGDWLDVTVEPGDGDRYGFLKRAADLFRWALANERRVLHQAIESELLELYNDVWRQGSDPELSAEEFEAELDWQGLTISASDLVLVEFGYGDGERELFGGHCVFIELDAELKFRSAHL